MKDYNTIQKTEASLSQILNTDQFFFQFTIYNKSAEHLI